MGKKKEGKKTPPLVWVVLLGGGGMTSWPLSNGNLGNPPNGWGKSKGFSDKQKTKKKSRFRPPPRKVEQPC